MVATRSVMRERVALRSQIQDVLQFERTAHPNADRFSPFPLPLTL
jgi:hypothetical protein